MSDRAADVLAADLAYIDPRTDELVLRAVDQRTVVTEGDVGGTARNSVAALLATTEPGEPVVITAEGRLMRLEVVGSHCTEHGFCTLSAHWCPCEDVDPLYLCRLTPLEPSPKETP